MTILCDYDVRVRPIGTVTLALRETVALVDVRIQCVRCNGSFAKEAKGEAMWAPGNIKPMPE
jgi:hypothetical protein